MIILRNRENRDGDVRTNLADNQTILEDNPESENIRYFCSHTALFFIAGNSYNLQDSCVDVNEEQ